MSEQKKEPMTTGEKWGRAAFILCIIAIMVAAGFWVFWTRETQVVKLELACPAKPRLKREFASGILEFDESAPTPTPTPEYYDVDGIAEWLTAQWEFAPELDYVLFIDWPDSIIITDAFSQTTVIAGPVTVRFDTTMPTPTPTLAIFQTSNSTSFGRTKLGLDRSGGGDLSDGLDTGRRHCPPCYCPPKCRSDYGDALVVLDSLDIDGSAYDGE